MRVYTPSERDEVELVLEYLTYAIPDYFIEGKKILNKNYHPGKATELHRQHKELIDSYLD